MLKETFTIKRNGTYNEYFEIQVIKGTCKIILSHRGANNQCIKLDRDSTAHLSYYDGVICTYLIGTFKAPSNCDIFIHSKQYDDRTEISLYEGFEFFELCPLIQNYVTCIERRVLGKLIEPDNHDDPLSCVTYWISKYCIDETEINDE